MGGYTPKHVKGENRKRTRSSNVLPIFGHFDLLTGLVEFEILDQLDSSSVFLSLSLSIQYAYPRPSPTFASALRIGTRSETRDWERYLGEALSCR